MIAINISLRDMESLLAVLKTPWDAEPASDHSTTGDHPDTIDEDRLQLTLTKTVQMCTETAGWTSGSTASDGSGVEMDRCETVKKDGLEKRRKKRAKYHVAAIPGLQFVPDSGITPGDTHDTKVPGPMMGTIKEQELDMGPPPTDVIPHATPRKTSSCSLIINWIPTSGRGRRARIRKSPRTCPTGRKAPRCSAPQSTLSGT